ncbi:uncharacterized protein LOC117292450 [Asterias rubens]|uniref:uncharacterized protein LOC117292450 n=1 Tax=Asterias rubens TaxID=7604 RepID=UPI0014551820|nr:uncharacterized protein LOC117292450 [Asterias rubens]
MNVGNLKDSKDPCMTEQNPKKRHPDDFKSLGHPLQVKPVEKQTLKSPPTVLFKPSPETPLLLSRVHQPSCSSLLQRHPYFSQGSIDSPSKPKRHPDELKPLGHPLQVNPLEKQTLKSQPTVLLKPSPETPLLCSRVHQPSSSSLLQRHLYSAHCVHQPSSSSLLLRHPYSAQESTNRLLQAFSRDTSTLLKSPPTVFVKPSPETPLLLSRVHQPSSSSLLQRHLYSAQESTNRLLQAFSRDTPTPLKSPPTVFFKPSPETPLLCSRVHQPSSSSLLERHPIIEDRGHKLHLEELTTWIYNQRDQLIQTESVGSPIEFQSITSGDAVLVNSNLAFVALNL